MITRPLSVSSSDRSYREGSIHLSCHPNISRIASLNRSHENKQSDYSLWHSFVFLSFHPISLSPRRDYQEEPIGQSSRPVIENRAIKCDHCVYLERIPIKLSGSDNACSPDDDIAISFGAVIKSNEAFWPPFPSSFLTESSTLLSV